MPLIIPMQDMSVPKGNVRSKKIHFSDCEIETLVD